MKPHLLAVLILCACADPLLASEDTEDSGPLAPLQPGHPEGSDCDFPEARTLLVTTTDFATGAITIVEADGTLRTDVGPGSPDAIPYPAPGGAAIVHRHGYDFVDLLEAGSWRSQGQHALEASDTASPNPHAIAFDADGLGYITAFGSSELLVFDPLARPGDSVVEAIELSPFADDDGRPEASLAMVCGDTLWVGVQRLDVPGGYRRVDEDLLIAIDLTTRTPWDFDPQTPGGQGLPLRGAWLRQLRADPASPQAVWGLTSGLERLDLASRHSEWIVPPDAFATVGVEHYLQPLAFDLGPDGRWAWVAAYVAADGDDVNCSDDPTPCFDHARLFEVDLLAERPVLSPFGEPFQAVDRTVVRIGNTLWVGSRERGAPGLYTYDLSTHPPTLQGGPLSTGLPPYSMTGLP